MVDVPQQTLRPNLNRVSEPVSVLRRLLEMIRFSHTLFALPFALLSASLAWADEPFRVVDLLGILVCMVFARSFAMAFNRLVDRDHDAKNPRTAMRHLPAGTLSVRMVVLFAVANALLFIASTGLFLLRDVPNFWPMMLAVPVLMFVGGYSLAKRFTMLVHFWLGAALMLAPVAAWIAVRGLTEMTVPLVLGAAVMFWVAGFDLLYACQDAAFDAAEGLNSIPARFGVKQSLRIAAVCHAIMFGVLIALGFSSDHLRFVYFGGLCAVGVLLLYQHAIVRPNDLSRVNRAFFQVNGIISVGLLVLVWIELAISFWQ